MSASHLNGSVERFAQALRDMVREATQEAVEPLRADIGSLQDDVSGMKSDVAQVRGEVSEIHHKGQWHK